MPRLETVEDGHIVEMAEATGPEECRTFGGLPGGPARAARPRTAGRSSRRHPVSRWGSLLLRFDSATGDWFRSVAKTMVSAAMWAPESWVTVALFDKLRARSDECRSEGGGSELVPVRAWSSILFYLSRI